MKKDYAFLFALVLTAAVVAVTYFYTVPRIMSNADRQLKKDHLETVQEKDEARDAITSVPSIQPRQTYVMSATPGADGVVIEQRALADNAVSEVEHSVTLRVEPRYHTIERLEFGPTGEYFFVSARSPHILAFPQNLAAVHSVWMLKTAPLKLVRELALSERTSMPYWLDGETLRFAVGDQDGKAVDYKIGTGDKVVAHTLDRVPPREPHERAEMAARKLKEHGLTFYTHVYEGGPPASPDSLPEQRVGHSVVSDDGATIAANVWKGVESDTFAVILRKHNEKWEVTRLPGDDHRTFAVYKKWIAVISSPNYHATCQVFGQDLSKPLAEFAAEAVDIY